MKERNRNDSKWRRPAARALCAALGFAGMACAALALAQAPQKPAAAPSTGAQRLAAKQARTYYDVYEPSQRQRLRRDTCMKDEALSGPYCVKKCNTGYVKEGTNPIRCRSLTPLPPGSLPPTSIRKQTAVQPVPRRPDNAPPPKPGA